MSQKHLDAANSTLVSIKTAKTSTELLLGAGKRYEVDVLNDLLSKAMSACKNLISSLGDTHIYDETEQPIIRLNQPGR